MTYFTGRKTGSEELNQHMVQLRSGRRSVQHHFPLTSLRDLTSNLNAEGAKETL